MFLYIDSILASEAKVTKRMKQINKLFLGGIPAGSSDFLENSVRILKFASFSVRNIV